MTTILVDVEKRTIYSDSRATVISNGIEMFGADSVKLFRHPSNKLIAGTFGCLKTSWEILNNLGFKTPQYANGLLVDSLSNKSAQCGVLLLNIYNDTVTYIERKTTKTGNEEYTKIQYCRGATGISGGSGNKIVWEVFKHSGCPVRAMRYAGLIDKYSDTDIKKITF